MGEGGRTITARVALAALGLAIPALLLLPGSASAAVSCDLTAGTLTVNVTGTSDQVAAVKMIDSGTNIGVFSDLVPGPANQQVCNVDPVPAATTQAIQVNDTDPGTQRTIVQVNLGGGPFVNGISEGGGDNEIEITIDGGNENTDDLVVEPGPGTTADNWRMGDLSAGPGDEGINLNDGETGTVDVDDVHALNMEQLQVGINGNDGDDILDARGGVGFTGPMTMTSTVKQLVSGSGDDEIYAGNGDLWRIEGQTGADTMVGGPGNDTMWASFGSENDVIDGNGGIDICTWQNHNDPVTVDLGQTGPQDTVGAGVDTITECEQLNGGNGGDTLTGDAGANLISGLAGDDTLSPGPGTAADALDGGPGISDTVDYSDAGPGGATLSLAAAGAQNTGSYGFDTITATENLVGTPSADTLTGDAQINRIEGGDGVDVINLGDNDDVFDSYDAVADTVDCGDGTDSGFASEAGVDTLTSCEIPDFAPNTTVSDGPPDGSTIGDPTPVYDLTASEGLVDFELQVDGGTYVSCGTPCTVPTLTDGTHTLRFRAIEIGGVQHPDPTPVQRMVTVDTQAPAISIDSGPSGNTPDTSPTFTFSSGDATATLECSVDGAPFGPCSGTGTHTASGLALGAHTFAVRATDPVGNEAVASRNFAVVEPPDTAPPNTVAKKPKVKGDTAKIKFSSTEPGSRFTCKLDRKKARACKSPVRYRNLDDGKHKVIVTAIDAAGNADPTPAKVKFKVG